MCMPSGRVKWFDDIKGYGYLEESNGGQIFVHFSIIEMNGFKTLNAGDTVEFEFVDDEMGPRATKIFNIRKSDQR